MIPRRMLRTILGSILAFAGLAFSHLLLGQAVNGTLLGTVADSAGAVVSNAQVTVVLISEC